MATMAALTPLTPTATTTTASSSSSVMDIDENDLPASSEGDLAERLSRTHLGENNGITNHNKNQSDKETTPITANSSEDSTDGESEIITPETGYFIDSSSGNGQSRSNNAVHHQPQSTQGLPPWPVTPPRTSLGKDAYCSPKTSSCPRPSVTSPRSPHNRPLFISSSSGALRPPTMESMSEDDNNNANRAVHPADNDDDDDDMGPASRAAAALQVLEHATYDNDNDKPAPWDDAATPSSHASSADISRQETFHTSHSSKLLLRNGQQEGPKRTFDAYPSKANDPLPPSVATTEDGLPSLYTFSPHLAGRALTKLSIKFVPRHNQHAHGGSALAGFLALLLVTCANYMLGPMRDAASSSGSSRSRDSYEHSSDSITREYTEGEDAYSTSYTSRDDRSSDSGSDGSTSVSSYTSGSGHSSTSRSDRSSEDDSDPSILSELGGSLGVISVTRNEDGEDVAKAGPGLGGAIDASDWQAVGEAAEQLRGGQTTDGESSYEGRRKPRSGLSTNTDNSMRSNVTDMSKDTHDELDGMIDAGDWGGIIDAASNMTSGHVLHNSSGSSGDRMNSVLDID